MTEPNLFKPMAKFIDEKTGETGVVTLNYDGKFDLDENGYGSVRLQNVTYSSFLEENNLVAHISHSANRRPKTEISMPHPNLVMDDLESTTFKSKELMSDMLRYGLHLIGHNHKNSLVIHSHSKAKPHAEKISDALQEVMTELKEKKSYTFKTALVI